MELHSSLCHIGSPSEGQDPGRLEPTTSMRTEVSDINDYRQAVRVRFQYLRIGEAVSIDRQKSLGLGELTPTGASPSFQEDDHSRVDENIDVGKLSAGRNINDRNVSFDVRSNGKHRMQAFTHMANLTILRFSRGHQVEHSGSQVEFDRPPMPPPVYHIREPRQPCLPPTP